MLVALLTVLIFRAPLNNLSVLQKTLILVCTPLLFQVAFAFLLFNSLSELNQAIQKELNCQSVIASANLVYQASLEGAVRGATNVLTRRAPIESIFKEHAGLAQKAVARLKVLTSEDLLQSSRVNRVAELAQKIERECIAENREQSNNSLLGTLVELRRYRLLESLVEPLAAETRAIVDSETSKLKTSQVESKRQSVYLVLFSGLVLDLAIGVALAYFFAVGMVQRLLILTKNASDFAGKELSELDPNFGSAIRGSDELALLDSSFRKMAQTISKAKQWRHEYLSMLNHDIRLPLTSAIGVVALCERGAYGKLLASAPARLKCLAEELMALVDLLEDLLDVERINAGMLVCRPDDCRLDDVLPQAVAKALSAPGLDGQTINYTPGNLRIRNDAQKINRLFSRLLASIAQSTGSGASISVCTQSSANGVFVFIDYVGPQFSLGSFEIERQMLDFQFGREYMSKICGLLSVSISSEALAELTRVKVEILHR